MKRPHYIRPKRVLRLPALDHAKAAVLNTLSSPDSQHSYRFAINDFIADGAVGRDRRLVITFVPITKLSSSTSNSGVCQPAVIEDFR